MKAPKVTLLIAILFAACGSDQNGEEYQEVIYTVVVQANFEGADVEQNRQAHDAVAGGGQADAQANGDLAHMVFLGAQDPREFLAIDLWDNLEGMQAFFNNPDVQAAFGSLFVQPPVPGVYIQPEGYLSWGELSPTPGSSLVIVRGTLASLDPDENMAAHNAVTEGGRETALSLGDYAHVTHLAMDDPRQFMAIDLWSDPVGMQQFFSDENVQQAFASLFAEPPTIQIYTTSDYLQW